MLELAQDYIPIDKRREVAHSVTTSLPVEVTLVKRKKTTIAEKHTLSAKYGLTKNFFMPNTKKNRFIRLLGKGELEKGYLVYLKLIKNLLKEFNKMYDILDGRAWGVETFNHYFGQKPTYLQTLKLQANSTGFTRHEKISAIHLVLKQFNELENIKEKAVLYIPLEKRLSLTKKFLKKYYWNKKMTSAMLAEDLIVPVTWIDKEVARLGMEKKKNGIKLRGRKNYVMPESERIKHRNQPHAKPVVQICPKKFIVKRRWNSTGGVERDGWGRKNVSSAVKNAGLHDGFLWAYEGKEKETIERAKAKGNLEQKLKVWENGHIEKELLKELYLVQDMSHEEIAKQLDCTRGAVACRTSKFGFKKRLTISDETLRELYINQNMEAKQIAEKHGFTVSTIRSYLSRRGICKEK